MAPQLCQGGRLDACSSKQRNQINELSQKINNGGGPRRQLHVTATSANHQALITSRKSRKNLPVKSRSSS